MIFVILKINQVESTLNNYSVQASLKMYFAVLFQTHSIKLEAPIKAYVLNPFSNFRHSLSHKIQIVLTPPRNDPLLQRDMW